MKRFSLLLLAILASCGSVKAQGVRVGNGQSSPVTTTTILSQKVLAPVPGALLQFCNTPASGVPCTNKATTYTDATLSTPCPTSAQVVLDGTSNCVAATDSLGNWGVWVPAGQYAYTFSTPAGNFGPFFATASGSGGTNNIFTGVPWLDNRTNSASCNGSSDDTTANTATINAVSAGGTAFLCNNTIWTPASFTAPTFWTSTALGGKTTVKSTWTLPNLTRVFCHDPEQGATNLNFSYLPMCLIAPLPASVSPVLGLTGIGNYLNSVQLSGFTGVGIHSYQPNSYYDDVFSVSAANGSTAYVSDGSFGHYFRRGSFSQPTGSTSCATNPSMFMHSNGHTGGVVGGTSDDTSRIDEFDKTFLNGCGIHYDTVGTPIVGGLSTNIRSIMQLYENAGGDPLFNFDVTGNSYQYVSIYDPVISDNTGTTPVVGVTGSIHGTVKDIHIWNPSGNSVFRIASGLANTTVVSNALVFGPSSGNPNILGLYGPNANYYLFRNSSPVFDGGGTNGSSSFSGIGNIQVGMGDPYQFACTGSSSGGTVAAGTYYLSAAYEDAAGNEGQLSAEVGPITTTGSTSSFSCTWSNQTFEAGSVVATRIFTGTASETYTLRYRTTNTNSFTVVGSGGTSAAPTQLMPTASTMALIASFGRTRNQSATNEFFGMGTNVSVGVGTQTPSASYKMDIVGAGGIRAAKLTTLTTTVGALPSAASNAGAMIAVSDSTAVAAEGQTCVGGSSNTALAFSNGVIWKCF